MKDFKLNWKIVSLLSVAILATLAFIVWKDYQRSKVPVAQEEIYPKRLASDIKTEIKTDTKYAATLQRRIKELESQQAQSNSKYEELLRMYQQVLTQLDTYKDFFTKLQQESCVADWENKQYYSYSKGNVQCYFYEATKEIKKEYKQFKAYVEDRMS